ncbi:peptidylprolyl isomerase [Achromobacter aloeverae]|uniref:peptidylprolyl isomerase n=1 Tax=Achromobacter aloeverae TaxID=1750518 RepID=A0A4Q1HD87_9BURK|nr:hypothetical protein C7R54_26145 [Achromobacter aloeverae]
MKKVLLLAAWIMGLMLGASLQAQTAPAPPRVKIATSQGDIVVELYPDKAPRTVENFLQYVKSGFYNGTVFHRVIPGFMIQGGGYDGALVEKRTRGPIPLEAGSGLRNLRGTLAAARTANPNSATSQFYINLVDNPSLDAPKPDGHGYAVFGRVVNGMDVVDRVASSPTRTVGMYANVPVQAITVASMNIDVPAPLISARLRQDEPGADEPAAPTRKPEPVAPPGDDAGVYGFETVPANAIDKGEVCQVRNMPPLMHQGTLGICFAAAASTLLTAENCRALKEDCQRVTRDKMFSVIALSADGAAQDQGGDLPSINMGGSTAAVLQEIAYNKGQAPSEECASLDDATKKIGGAEVALETQLRFWNWLEQEYRRQHAVVTKCEACFLADYPRSELRRKLTESLNMTVADKDVAAGLALPDYRGFIMKILINKRCRRLSTAVQFENMYNVKVKLYPEQPKGKGNYKQAIAYIKEALLDQRPLALGNVCMDKAPSASKCKNLHGVVIAGYKQVCDPSGKRCADALRVINSWGQGWQAEHNDGWVYAKPLLDRTFYTQATLSWFAERGRSETASSNR